MTAGVGIFTFTARRLTDVCTLGKCVAAAQRINQDLDLLYCYLLQVGDLLASEQASDFLNFIFMFYFVLFLTEESSLWRKPE